MDIKLLTALIFVPIMLPYNYLYILNIKKGDWIADATNFILLLVLNVSTYVGMHALLKIIMNYI